MDKKEKNNKDWKKDYSPYDDVNEIIKDLIFRVQQLEKQIEEKISEHE